MSESSRHRYTVIVILILFVLLALLFAHCRRSQLNRDADVKPSANDSAHSVVSSALPPATVNDETERVTPATVQAPSEVIAGATFPVKWTGPNNPNDFLTIAPKDASEGTYTNYRLTREGTTLELTATIEPGNFEVRYVTARSKKVLARSAITILSTAATLHAPAEAILGSIVPVEWSGPNNKDDYLTIVATGSPDGKYDNFSYTTKGSPLNVTAPVVAGKAEIRYVTGQGAKVLARRPIEIKTADITISAPVDCIAGSTVTLNWNGPNNTGDYITLVPREAQDGQYGNYSFTNAGSPLQVLVPIISGEAELRYMTGQGGKVLGRKSIRIIAAAVTLTSKDVIPADTEFAVEWTGPNNSGDYITVVPRTASDGQYGNYTFTAKGSPLKIISPKETGDAELRYMTGQGGKVISRRAVRIVPRS